LWWLDEMISGRSSRRFCRLLRQAAFDRRARSGVRASGDDHRQKERQRALQAKNIELLLYPVRFCHQTNVIAWPSLFSVRRISRRVTRRIYRSRLDKSGLRRSVSWQALCLVSRGETFHEYNSGAALNSTSVWRGAPHRGGVNLLARV
jgi:hypothetical protein